MWERKRCGKYSMWLAGRCHRRQINFDCGRSVFHVVIPRIIPHPRPKSTPSFAIFGMGYWMGYSPAPVSPTPPENHFKAHKHAH